MIWRRRLAIAAVGVLVTLTMGAAPLAASPSLNPQATLEQGRVAYERGNYSDAVNTIRPLLYPSIELGNEESVVEAHRLLALSFFFMTQQPEAEAEAASLLALRPNYALDPVVDPPAAVSFFEAVRKKQDERLREVRQRQREEEERARKERERLEREKHAKAERVYVERTVEHHNRLIAFLPFGAGQFQNHQNGYGIGFAVAEVLLGAWWASMTLVIDRRYPTHQYPVADGGTFGVANTLVSLQVAAAGAFWGVVAWGILDAQIKYKPEIVHLRELPGAPPPPAKQPKTSASVGPILTPGLYGLGVQGAF